MIRHLYNKTLLFITLLFVSISNFSYASGARVSDKPATFADFLMFFFCLIIVLLVFLYFVVFRPYFKKKKTKEYCEKNHLTFIAESDEIPESTKYDFISFDTDEYWKLKYKYIIHGEKLGIIFTLCEFSFEYSEETGGFGSPLFNLLIIKKTNTNFPFFVLSNESNIKRYYDISFTCGNGYKPTPAKSDYKNHIHFYYKNNLKFNQDNEFNKRFVLSVENKEDVENFFNDKIRRLFKEKSKTDCVYEGNDDCFIISKTINSFLYSFEDNIKFLEENLRLYSELTSV